jgi:hypothetical protein
MSLSRNRRAAELAKSYTLQKCCFGHVFTKVSLVLERFIHFCYPSSTFLCISRPSFTNHINRCTQLKSLKLTETLMYKATFSSTLTAYPFSVSQPTKMLRLTVTLTSQFIHKSSKVRKCCGEALFYNPIRSSFTSHYSKVYTYILLNMYCTSISPNLLYSANLLQVIQRRKMLYMYSSSVSHTLIHSANLLQVIQRRKMLYMYSSSVPHTLIHSANLLQVIQRRKMSGRPWGQGWGYCCT